MSGMSEVLARLAPALADRYRIEREVGAGAMATVYLAHDLKHDREVALKVLRPDLAAVLGIERFLNEIRITARLDHPHILTLIDSGTADGFLYYVLPFVRGESLRERIRREKQLSVSEALAITRQVGSALEYAHRQGVIHRDIKPENILLHEGEAMLTDFGIALAVKQAAGTRLTETGRSLGTPQYMSPEQATGDRILDARSDVYSLAAVLYEMLAGEPPHTGPTAQAIIAKLLTERPVRLRVLRDTLPEGLDVSVARALSRVPADRYANAGDFIRALATADVPQRESGHSKHWIPIAIGVGATALAIAAVVIAGRGAPPAPPVDRIQLTTTGNIVMPSMSPDGSRLAFGERVCDQENSCTHRLVIQDVDGTGRLEITGNIAWIGGTQWTRDGKYLLYVGSYGADRWGTFSVSTLGGTPRYLGCCRGVPLSGDTVMVFRSLALNDTLGWVRLASLRGGQPRDSIPIRQPGLRFTVVPTGFKDRLLALIRTPDEKGHELRLIDYDGNIIDRSTSGLEVGDREVAMRWMAATGDLLLAIQREQEGNEYDFLRIKTSNSRIEPRVDTVLQRVVMADGAYDVTPDGASLVYAAGPLESSIWASDRDSASSGETIPSRELFTSTTVAFARISPDGNRVLVGRQIVTDGRRRFQLFLTPFTSWVESQLTPPLEDYVSVQWTPDGRHIIYANRAGSRTQLVEVDTAGRRSRVIATVDRSMVASLYPLRDRGVALIGESRRSIAIVGRPGRKDVTWQTPKWLGVFAGLSPSPDARSLGILAWDVAVDSAIVAKVDLETGAFTRFATLGAENFADPMWLNDGSLMFDIHESNGAQGLYSLRPGAELKRLASLPHAPAVYSVSADGRRLIATSRSNKMDVYMVRNFGDFLR